MGLETVILVDKDDNMVGIMEKMAAHRSAILHRAVSVFVFNTKGEMLLQQRAGGKYHSGGKWSNACCSHPRIGEKPFNAAKRRLKEEMGLECDLEQAFSFTYHADLTDGMFEHEYDHVFVGITDAVPEPNIHEVSNFVYKPVEQIKRELAKNPGEYTEWFKICFPEVIKNFKRLKNE